jgi:hypothetical protein
MVEMKTYRIWGEYGPCASDKLELIVRARSRDNAMRRLIRELKRDGHWNRTGLGNCYVEEIV